MIEVKTTGLKSFIVVGWLGCVPENLCSVSHASQQTYRCLIHMALINKGSVANNTFILNNFFTSCSFLLMEIWIKPGENSAFSELLPPGCAFFTSPRTSGRGGGLAAIFNDSCRCCLLPTNAYSCFQLQLFVLSFSSPVLYAVIYRPAKYNKDFTHEFFLITGGLWRRQNLSIFMTLFVKTVS